MPHEMYSTSTISFYSIVVVSFNYITCVFDTQIVESKIRVSCILVKVCSLSAAASAARVGRICDMSVISITTFIIGRIASNARRPRVGRASAACG